ncbi:MAG: TetR/AcrR family transcriptional regulator [Gemmatimonadetes bacterium]|nr:TetR/AcrR family transcriptional regulator [Gemmatimonadota bacterium]MBL8961274.1 TetR/AcrR family transcriptional regulator [Gemmatimonadota bacterium]
MSRPRGDHDERREVIGLAAAEVIATRGLAQLTLRDLAAELGVTTGVLTHYFPSKDALVAYTKELVFDLRFVRAQQAAEGLEGIERLHAVVAEMLPVDAERRTGWRVLVAFQGSAVGSAPMRRAHDRRMRRWFALFDDLVAPLETHAAQGGMAVAFLVEGMAIHLSMMEPPMPAAWQLAFAREQVDRLVGARSPGTARRAAARPRGARRTLNTRRTTRSPDVSPTS